MMQHITAFVWPSSCRGKLFQSSRAATTIILSPLLFNLALEITKSKWSADLRAYDGAYTVLNSRDILKLANLKI